MPGKHLPVHHGVLGRLSGRQWCCGVWKECILAWQMLFELLGETKQLVKQREMLCLLSILRNDSSLRLQVCGYENTFNSPFQRVHSEGKLDKSGKNLQAHLQKKDKRSRNFLSRKNNLEGVI